MNRTRLAIVGAVVLALTIVVSSALFTVQQVQQGIVVRLGEPNRVLKEPGLHWKIPLIEEVYLYDNRILDLDPPSFEVLVTDRKRINIDAFARYRIVDPLLYYQRLRTETEARDRLVRVVAPALRRVIAQASLRELLSPRRSELMQQIYAEVQEDARSLGIEMVDVRIGRTDLPPETSSSVFDRMRAERERQARELRAEGKELAQKIRANADKTRTVILAEATRRSEALRGQGEGERNRILGEAYGQDPDFFRFYKSLSEYQRHLVGNETTLVLSPDSDFFRYFGNFSGDVAAPLDGMGGPGRAPGPEAANRLHVPAAR